MIAAYCRVSTTEQAEHGYSINEQQDRLVKYCEATINVKPKCYVDAGYSGAKLDRPALQRLIADVKAHKISKVIVYKLDRLSRSQKDTLMLIEDIFLQNNCDFVSVSENFDTSTPLGRAMIGILAVFAQLEREQIKERMSMGREARAKQGKYAGSWRHPIGYDYKDGQLVVNDFEKMQIQQIFELYASGMGIARIAETLNNAGLHHKYGEWSDTVIRSLLPRKTYIGYVKFNNEWYKGEHEPIISEELFNKVQSLMNRKKTDYAEKGFKYGYASSYLGGICTCARCGKKFYKYNNTTSSRGKKYSYDYYICTGRATKEKKTGDECNNTTWKMQELDELIFSEIRKLTFETSKRSKTANKTPVIEDKINELDKQLNRLLDLYTVGTMPLDKLQKKVDSINAQKARLEKELTTAADASLTQDRIKEVANSFDEILENGTIEDVREAIKALIDNIELDGDNVKIFWSF